MRAKKNRLAILIAAALMLGRYEALSSTELMVGTDILTEDISEFYYTYDHINYNAYYQRYRFYTEDGKKMFFHETRERKNDYGPATEADTTMTGCFELTEADWEAFFGLLKGGTVIKRTESTETGNAGPWMYLYWKNDEGEYQEYSFSSKSALESFKAFCAELALKTEPKGEE